MNKTNERLFAALLALVSATLVLMIATTSSPLYVTNFWTDTNIFLTMGRGIASGMVPYRDLVDQKGPLIFLIYAVAAIITDSSFLGAFVLECISMTAFLYIGWSIVILYGKGWMTYAAIPLTAMITVCCTAFTQGGSAEEFNLPFLCLAVYVTLKRMKEDNHSVVKKLLHAGFGFAMGWVFAVKYTDCGLFFGLGLCMVLWIWRCEGFACAVRAVLEMFLGFCVIVLPIVLYLTVNGALLMCLDTYFIQNMFVYSGNSMTLTGHIYNALAYLRTQSMANPAVAGMAMAGVGIVSMHALLTKRRGLLFHMAAMPMAAGLLLLFCYWGEMAHPYYALAFAALVPLGMIPLGFVADWVDRHAKKMAIGVVLACLCLTLILPQQLCLAVPLQNVKKEDMPQTLFAEIMKQEESPTLLDISSLDHGFYLAADILPTCRYFCELNVESPAKREALQSYLADGVTQFVVTRYMQPGERYELIAEASGVFDLYAPQTYYLYKRIEEMEDGSNH